MSPADALVNPPAITSMIPYPLMIGAALNIILTSIMLWIAAKFDPTQGTLTISLIITIGMLGAVFYCLIFTIPTDDITPGVVGGLTAGFGAVVAHWLGRKEPPMGGTNGDDSKVGKNGNGKSEPPPP